MPIQTGSTFVPAGHALELEEAPRAGSPGATPAPSSTSPWPGVAAEGPAAVRAALESVVGAPRAERRADAGPGPSRRAGPRAQERWWRRSGRRPPEAVRRLLQPARRARPRRAPARHRRGLRRGLERAHGAWRRPRWSRRCARRRQKQALGEALEKATGKTVELTTRVDPPCSGACGHASADAPTTARCGAAWALRRSLQGAA